MYKTVRIPKDPQDPYAAPFAVVQTFGEISPLLIRTFHKRESAVDFADFHNKSEAKGDR